MYSVWDIVKNISIENEKRLFLRTNSVKKLAPAMMKS